jgi:hypothetical protein
VQWGRHPQLDASDQQHADAALDCIHRLMPPCPPKPGRCGSTATTIRWWSAPRSYGAT